MPWLWEWGGAIGTSAGITPKETRAEASTSGTFFKVKTADGIVIGDKVLFVDDVSGNALREIGGTSTKYGLPTSVTVSGNSVVLDENDVEVFDVEIGADDTGFSFKGTSNISGNYLYWGSGNSLNSNSKKTVNTSWSLSAAEETLSIKSNKENTRVMRFNSDRFACYTTETGNQAQIYRKVSVSAVSSITASVSAKQGADMWSVSSVTVTGTANGVPGTNVTDYVDIAPVTEVPLETYEESFPVTFTVTRKSGVGGSESLSSLTVSNATVSADPFINYRPVRNASDVNTHTLYALGYEDKSKFVSNGTGFPSVDSDSNVALFRLESTSGGYYLRQYTGSSFPYTEGNYINNSSSTDITSSDTKTTIWTKHGENGLVNLLNSGNGNRWLANYVTDTKNDVRAYNSGTQPKLYLYSAPTDTLTSIAPAGQTTAFDVGDSFSFGGSVTATYSISGTTGHTGITSSLTYKFKAPGAAEFDTMPATFAYSDNGGTVKVTYTDAWENTASTTYEITVSYAAITGLSLDTGSSISLGVTGSHSFIATPIPANANPNVTWAASNTTFVEGEDFTLTSSGVLTMTTDRAGTLTVTATSAADAGVSASCLVTIIGDPVVALDITSLADKYTGDSDQLLTATASSFVGEITYTWTSSNNDVATVTQDSTYANKATVHYVGTGTATISVHAVGATSGEDTANCSVSVTSSAVTAITLSESSGTLYLGSSEHVTKTISVTDYTLVGNATEGVTWETSDAEVATVSNGVIAAVGVGEATITARSTYTTSTFATFALTVVNDSVASLIWGSRGTVDCFAGTTIRQALKYTAWTFNGTYASGESFDQMTWNDVGTGEGKVHIGLYDSASPASEGVALSLDYAFQASDNGKYLVAFYEGAKTSDNTAVTVTETLNSISAAAPYELTTTIGKNDVNITAPGVSGGGEAASANRFGFTLSSTDGYFSSTDLRSYQGSDLTISSDAGKIISSIVLTFSGSYDGGIEGPIENINNTSRTLSLQKQARITGVSITYQETDYANANLTAQKAVIEFAETVNTQMNAEGVCSTGGVYGSHNIASMKSAWNTIATKYNNLFGDGEGHLTDATLVAAQNMLGKATAKWDDGPDCLQRALKTYDFVVANYATELAEAGVDTVAFMSAIRTPSGVARVNSMSYADETMNPALLVVILAGLSAAVVGVYFFLKRRQERE